MNTISPINCNENQSSSSYTKTKQLTVPNNLEPVLGFKTDKIIPTGDDLKVPISPKVLNNVNVTKFYESIRDETNTNDVNSKFSSDLTSMSPVEGPVNDIPKNIFDKNPENQGSDNHVQSDGCEEFAGQIVYNPDGSAYIIEDNDESLLEQIPKQEGSIVERGGKCQSEVEYPKIDQAVFIARH